MEGVLIGLLVGLLEGFLVGLVVGLLIGTFVTLVFVGRLVGNFHACVTTERVRGATRKTTQNRGHRNDLEDVKVVCIAECIARRFSLVSY